MKEIIATKFVENCDQGNLKEIKLALTGLSAPEREQLIKCDDYAGFHHADVAAHTEIVDFILNQVNLRMVTG